MLLASLAFCFLLFISSLVYAGTSQGFMRGVWGAAAVIQAGCVAVDVYFLVGGL